MEDNYSDNVLQLVEIKSCLKILQSAMQNEETEIDKSDIDHFLTIILEKFEKISDNFMNFSDQLFV